MVNNPCVASSFPIFGVYSKLRLRVSCRQNQAISGNVSKMASIVQIMDILIRLSETEYHGEQEVVGFCHSSLFNIKL